MTAVLPVLAHSKASSRISSKRDKGKLKKANKEERKALAEKVDKTDAIFFAALLFIYTNVIFNIVKTL